MQSGSLTIRGVALLLVSPIQPEFFCYCIEDIPPVFACRENVRVGVVSALSFRLDAQAPDWIAFILRQMSFEAITIRFSRRRGSLAGAQIRGPGNPLTVGS